MSEHELKLLGGKAKLWKILHPEVSGYCALCHHLYDLEYFRKNNRCTYNKTTGVVKVEKGVLGIGFECVEWVKYV